MVRLGGVEMLLDAVHASTVAAVWYHDGGSTIDRSTTDKGRNSRENEERQKREKNMAPPAVIMSDDGQPPSLEIANIVEQVSYCFFQNLYIYIYMNQLFIYIYICQISYIYIYISNFLHGDTLSRKLFFFFPTFFQLFLNFFFFLFFPQKNNKNNNKKNNSLQSKH